MRALLLAIALMTTPAIAQVPNVMTDIAPVQSLAALVMGDLGTPGQLLDPAADPHNVQLRPSQASALSRADLVISMGDALTPWLTDTAATLAPEAVPLLLLDLPGLTQIIETDAPDPHAWLDPLNAAQYLPAIAAALSDLDPANAPTYRTNADAAVQQLQALDAEVRQTLAPMRDAALIAYHDAYRYFLNRYDLRQVGFVTDTAGTAPGVASIGALRDALAATTAPCIMVEPGTRPALIDSLGLTDAKIVEIDALGLTLTPGPDLYATMIRKAAETLATCAKP